MRRAQMTNKALFPSFFQPVPREIFRQFAQNWPAIIIVNCATLRSHALDKLWAIRAPSIPLISVISHITRPVRKKAFKFMSFVKILRTTFVNLLVHIYFLVYIAA